MYEIFEQLLQKYGLTAYKVAKETGVTQSTLSDWKNGRSKPKTENLKKIADFFGVTLDYLMTGEKKPSHQEITLTVKDDRDIETDIDIVLKKLRNGKSGPAFYGGVEISQNDIEFFADQLEIMIKRLRKINEEQNS